MNDTEPVSIRLERGESVKWYDGEGWHVGTVLVCSGRNASYGGFAVLVQVVDGIYVVSEHALASHQPRCERCGGEGTLYCEDAGVCNGEIVHYASTQPCPECGGSGRQRCD